jgi:hypothetical protein
MLHGGESLLLLAASGIAFATVSKFLSISCTAKEFLVPFSQGRMIFVYECLRCLPVASQEAVCLILP